MYTPDAIVVVVGNGGVVKSEHGSEGNQGWVERNQKRRSGSS